VKSVTSLTATSGFQYEIIDSAGIANLSAILEEREGLEKGYARREKERGNAREEWGE
jgi:hypothetical protein